MDAFVMTDRELAENAAEREARTLAMLAEADYSDYLADQAEQYAAELEGESDDSPVCRECDDSGAVRFSTGFGLSDWVEVACSFCTRKVA